MSIDLSDATIHDFEIEVVIERGRSPEGLLDSQLLPRGYELSFVGAKSWQARVRPNDEFSGPLPLGAAVVKICQDLQGLINSLLPLNCALRIGIFFETATCTIALPAEALEEIANAKLAVIISTYPSGDDEDRPD